MEAKIAPGRLRDGENGPRSFPEPPGPEPVIFFGPGGLQERSGVDFYSVLAPRGSPGGGQGGPSVSGTFCAAIVRAWFLTSSFGLQEHAIGSGRLVGQFMLDSNTLSVSDIWLFVQNVGP